MPHRPMLFPPVEADSVCIILLYVDDILMMGNHNFAIESKLHSRRLCQSLIQAPIILAWK